LVTLRDVRVAVRHDLLIMTCAWLVVFTGGIWLLLSINPPRMIGDLPSGVWEHIKPGWIAWWVGWFVPLAFFLTASLARGAAERTVPFVGLAACAFSITVLVDGWLVPMVDAQTPVFWRDQDSHRVFRNLSSMGPPTLPSALLRSDYNVLWALSQLNSTLARGLSGAALVILAGAFWGTRIWVRVLVAALVLATVWSVGFTSWHPALFSYERLIRAWLIPAGAMLVAAAVALRKKGRATITAECS
jgi:hypothetical protein